MIMMLVSETQDKSENLVKFFKEQSIDIVHYNSPVKALDNIQEIRPDAIVIDAVDFPRHWKVITQYLRYDTSKNDIVVILIVNDVFSVLEVDKTIKVGVQGVINVDLPYEAVVIHARDILSKYKCATFNSKRREGCVSSQSCSFLFVEPHTESIVTGKVKDLTATSLLFIPDIKMEEIEVGDEIETCSLKLFDNIITPQCSVKEVKDYIKFEFINMKNDDENMIVNFLEDENINEKVVS